jgi:hypothetical protein
MPLPARRVPNVKAHEIFVPLGVIRNGPPLGFASWKQPGAMLAFIRYRGIDAESFVNWTKARLGGAGGPHIGYKLYFFGPEPTQKQRDRFLTP